MDFVEELRNLSIKIKKQKMLSEAKKPLKMPVSCPLSSCWDMMFLT